MYQNLKAATQRAHTDSLLLLYSHQTPSSGVRAAHFDWRSDLAVLQWFPVAPQCEPPVPSHDHLAFRCPHGGSFLARSEAAPAVSSQSLPWFQGGPTAERTFGSQEAVYELFRFPCNSTSDFPDNFKIMLQCEIVFCKFLKLSQIFAYTKFFNGQDKGLHNLRDELFFKGLP